MNDPPIRPLTWTCCWLYDWTRGAPTVSDMIAYGHWPGYCIWRVGSENKLDDPQHAKKITNSTSPWTVMQSKWYTIYDPWHFSYYIHEKWVIFVEYNVFYLKTNAFGIWIVNWTKTSVLKSLPRALKKITEQSRNRSWTYQTSYFMNWHIRVKVTQCCS